MGMSSVVQKHVKTFQKKRLEKLTVLENVCLAKEIQILVASIFSHRTP